MKMTDEVAGGIGENPGMEPRQVLEGRRADGRFVPGHPPTPGSGRPPGSKDRLPRSSIRRVYDRLMEKEGIEDKILEGLERAIEDKREIRGVLELGAKLFKEIGPDGAVMAAQINVYTNVDPMALRPGDDKAIER